MGWVRNNISNMLLGLAAAAIIFCAGFTIYQGLKLQRAYENKTTESAQAARDHAGEQVDRYCVPLPPDGERDCRREVEDSYRDYYRESRDLEAQRTTAIWTALMGGAALLGMAISVIGVALVYITFRETRKANVIAREGAEAQVRAWLTVEFKDVIGFRIVDEMPKFQARIRVANVGDSPALAVSYWMSMAFGNNPREHLDSMVDHYLETDLDWKEGSLFPGEDFVRKSSCDHDGEPPGQITKVSVYLLVAYRTALSDKTRITAHLFDVIDPARPDWTIDFKRLPKSDDIYMRTNKGFPGYAT